MVRRSAPRICNLYVHARTLVRARAQKHNTQHTTMQLLLRNDTLRLIPTPPPPPSPRYRGSQEGGQAGQATRRRRTGQDRSPQGRCPRRRRTCKDPGRPCEVTTAARKGRQEQPQAEQPAKPAREGRRRLWLQRCPRCRRRRCPCRWVCLLESEQGLIRRRG